MKMKNLNIVLSIVFSCGVIFANVSWAKHEIERAPDCYNCASVSTDHQAENATKATHATGNINDGGTVFHNECGNGQKCDEGDTCENSHGEMVCESSKPQSSKN